MILLNQLIKEDNINCEERMSMLTRHQLYFFRADKSLIKFEDETLHVDNHPLDLATMDEGVDYDEGDMHVTEDILSIMPSTDPSEDPTTVVTEDTVDAPDQYRVEPTHLDDSGPLDVENEGMFTDEDSSDDEGYNDTPTQVP